MFPGRYFSKRFYPGKYFPPAGGVMARIMVALSGPIKKVAHVLAFIKAAPGRGFKR